MEKQSYRVFLSYSRRDSSQVTPIYKLLKGLGHTVFMDEQSIPPGKKWQDAILEHLTNGEVLVVFWTQRASRSEHVKHEIHQFSLTHPDKPIIPLLVDGTPPPDEAKDFQHIDIVPLLNELLGLKRELQRQNISSREIRRVIRRRLREAGFESELTSNNRNIVVAFILLAGASGGWSTKTWILQYLLASTTVTYFTFSVVAIAVALFITVTVNSLGSGKDQTLSQSLDHNVPRTYNPNPTENSVNGPPDHVPPASNCDSNSNSSIEGSILIEGEDQRDAEKKCDQKVSNCEQTCQEQKNNLNATIATLEKKIADYSVPETGLDLQKIFEELTHLARGCARSQAGTCADFETRIKEVAHAWSENRILEFRLNNVLYPVSTSNYNDLRQVWGAILSAVSFESKRNDSKRPSWYPELAYYSLTDECPTNYSEVYSKPDSRIRLAKQLLYHLTKVSKYSTIGPLSKSRKRLTSMCATRCLPTNHQYCHSFKLAENWQEDTLSAAWNKWKEGNQITANDSN